MAFAGASLIADGKLCALTASPIDARANRGYHLLVVEGYSRSEGTPPNGEYIKSRTFLVGGRRWVIEYYPNGCDDDDEEFISIFLDSDEHARGQVKAHAVFSFIDQPELRMPARVRTNNIQPWPGYMFGEEKFIRRDILERSRHLKNDSFIIRCDIVVDKEAGSSASFVEMLPSDMQSHLSDLLLSKEGTDITFEVGGETFAAHRSVLAARSTVFKAQLFGGTNTTNIVEINDIKPEIFSKLLVFIYTDSFPDWIAYNGKAKSQEVKEEEKSETDLYVMWLLQLLEVADRYHIQRLKSICEETLADYIDVDTVADIIVVAERRWCPCLKDACLDVIKSCTSLYTVLTADSLDQIVKTCSPSVLKELLSKFAT